MEAVEGAAMFQATGDAYDGFMGRYARPLARVFAEIAEVAAGQSALDVGCGPGALTGVLVERLGPSGVTAIDPSAPFVAACAARHPGVTVRQGRAEELPFGDACFDRVLSQLVLHFVTDPERCAGEVRRVLRPGGVAAACVWDFAQGMQMLRLFWDAALELDPSAPDEARILRFGGEGEIAELLAAAGLVDIGESTLDVASTYADIDELWSGFLAGVGPAGAYCRGLDEAARAALRQGMVRRLGSPVGPFTLTATARCARGRAPG
jgi:SAM-dependent methyltransferase